MMDVLCSDQFNEIAGALATAQGAMENAEKNSTNPHFRSRYADIAAVRSATIPHLAANGIALIQQIRRDGANLLVKTMLIHSSGQWIASEFPVPPLQRVQELGSYITYARRYSWMGLCGIAPEDDDDGNAANTARAAPQRRPRLVASPLVPRQEEPAPEDYSQDPEPESGPLPAAGEGGAEDPAVPASPSIESFLAKAAGEGTDSLRTAWRNLTQAERTLWEQALYRRFLPMAKGVDEAMHGQGEATQN